MARLVGGNGGCILGTFVGCPDNSHWLHSNWHIWKMNLISLHTVSVIHSLYVHLLSRSESKIRWMLNLYVNFNIGAILYLKIKINASISFLMWCWMLSLLEKKSFPNASPQISISEGRGVLEEAILPFADGLFSDMLQSSHSIICYFSVKVNSKGSGFSLNYNEIYFLIGFWEFAGVGCVRSFMYPTGKATGLNPR